MNRTRGFTMIELMVAVTIVAIFAAIVLASLSDSREDALIANAQAELFDIRTAINLLYNGDAALYPNQQDSICRDSVGSGNEVNLNDTANGLTGNSSGTFSPWLGPYITEAIDPWGNPYYLDEDYSCGSPAHPDCTAADANGNGVISALVSCGANGAQSGGECVSDTDNVILALCDVT